VLTKPCNARFMPQNHTGFDAMNSCGMAGTGEISLKIIMTL